MSSNNNDSTEGKKEKKEPIISSEMTFYNCRSTFVGKSAMVEACSVAHALFYHMIRMKNGLIDHIKITYGYDFVLKMVSDVNFKLTLKPYADEPTVILILQWYVSGTLFSKDNIFINPCRVGIKCNSFEEVVPASKKLISDFLTLLSLQKIGKGEKLKKLAEEIWE